MQLSLTIKDFKQPDFANLQKLLARDQPDQGYGQLDIEMVDIKSLNLSQISKMTKFDFSQMIKPLQMRVSFFDVSLDMAQSPIIFSEEKLVKISGDEVSVTWNKESLPTLHSALNTVDLAKASRLLMFIWACGPSEHFPASEMLLGQVNIPMKDLMEENGQYILISTPKVVLSNQVVGDVQFLKIKYSSV